MNETVMNIFYIITKQFFIFSEKKQDLFHRLR